jgi:lysozyme
MAIKPPKTPQQSRKDTERLLRKAGVTDKVALVGIRGYYKNSMGKKNANDIGIYDDGIFVVSPQAYASFNANTDPSRLKPAVATLKAGVHRYKKGRHGISRGSGYPALRPATQGETLPVERYNAKTKTYYDGVGIAINIHKGSYNSTSSAGCQTIYPSQWAAFINLTYEEMDRYGQKTIPYLLIEND